MDTSFGWMGHPVEKFIIISSSITSHELKLLHLYIVFYAIEESENIKNCLQVDNQDSLSIIWNTLYM